MVLFFKVHDLIQYVSSFIMSTIAEDYVTSIVSQVASKCNLKGWRYTQQKFESIAQNYFGIIIPVTLTGENDGKEVSFHIVLKLAPTDERFRVSGAITLMFAREIYIYSTVLRNYEELQRNFSMRYLVPQCYHVCQEYCKEVIVMQDLHADGYIPYNNGMFLDLEHITISLECLAKLHALSFIMKDKKPELYNEITNECIPLSLNNNKRYFEIMNDRLSKAIKKFENSNYVTLLEKLQLNCYKFFDAAVENVQATCICHGDIWKENILFKYEVNKPISACLIDYQTTRLISPAFDTLYLIISSTNTDLRQEHWTKLLDTYYQTFDQMLTEAGLVSGTLYSRQTFESDLKVVGPACLITANTALWLLNGLQEEGHVRSKHICTTQEEKEQAVNQYKSIISAIIDDLSSYGFLNI